MYLQWLKHSNTIRTVRHVSLCCFMQMVKTEILLLPLACTVAQVQDIGTYLMLTARVGEHTLKARFAPETRLPSAGDAVWLQVLGEHTCFYQDEKLLAAEVTP